MFDIQHDSPVPIHEQIAGQVLASVATGALAAGTELPECLALARQLVTNAQVVARAYGDLEFDGVLAKKGSGAMEVTAGAEFICRVRLQDKARQRLYQAVAQAQASGLPEAEIRRAVDEQLAAPPVKPLAAEQLETGIKLPTQTPSHASSHRDSQGIQVLPRQAGRRSP
ncbi:MAG: GntR family transcriptional regulator [Planctomycetes bacterium]|nr:GntR family transcriptional regulator [Planctomycetota bacterium]